MPLRRQLAENTGKGVDDNDALQKQNCSYSGLFRFRSRHAWYYSFLFQGLLPLETGSLRFLFLRRGVRLSAARRGTSVPQKGGQMRPPSCAQLPARLGSLFQNVVMHVQKLRFTDQVSNVDAAAAVEVACLDEDLLLKRT